MTKRKIFITIIIILIIIPVGLFILQNISKTNQFNNNVSKTNGNEINQLNSNANQLSKSSQKTTIKIADIFATSSANFPASFASFPLFVAQEKDFFGQNGLKVQVIGVPAQSSIKILQDKQMDYSIASLGTGSTQIKTGIKEVMIYEKNYGYGLVIRSGLKINEIKKIAIISDLFSPSHYQALKFINDNNLSAEVIGVGGTPEEIKARLQNIQADAIIAPVFYALLFPLKEFGYISLKTFNDEILQGLSTTDDKIKNNPEEVRRIIASIKLALQFIQNSPVETKELLFKFFKVDKNEANQKIIEDSYTIAKQAFLAGNMPSQEGINTLIKLGKAGYFKTFQDVARQTVSQEDISKTFDFKFVK